MGHFRDESLHYRQSIALDWYWQPITMKQNTAHNLNTTEKQKKTTLANRAIYTLIWHAYHLWPGGLMDPMPLSYSPGAQTGQSNCRTSIDELLFDCAIGQNTSITIFFAVNSSQQFKVTATLRDCVRFRASAWDREGPRFNTIIA